MHACQLARPPHSLKLLLAWCWRSPRGPHAVLCADRADSAPASMVILTILVALSTVEAAFPSAWNDTDCHEPMQRGCATCCELNVTDPTTGAVTWAKASWSGNCDGCVTPGSAACATCFPGVRPWYNDKEFATPGTPVPAGCKKCSPCSIREMDDFRNSRWPKPQDCTCPPDPDPPSGECSAEKPGVMGCDCWCQNAARMSVLCVSMATVQFISTRLESNSSV